MTTILSPTLKIEKPHSLQGTLQSLEAQCRNCTPITPLECISRCQVYKLKNELRRLSGAMNNPNYTKELFNVLKNDTRLFILQTICNQRCSLVKLQGQLGKAQHFYSQETITEKYLRPLMAVGLANENREEFYATGFGARIAQPLRGFPEFGRKLHMHSECHEETVLQFLLSEPKTYQDIESIMGQNITSRVLERLLSAGLVKAPKDREYIFFFKSKRDPAKEEMTATEQKIYDSLCDEGIAAGKIAKKTGLCIRRIYKYLKRLKGKKLVFLRRTPKTYRLTCKGQKLALALKEIEQIVEDTWSSSQQIMR